MTIKYKFYDWWFIRGAYSNGLLWVFPFHFNFGFGVKNIIKKPLMTPEYNGIKLGNWYLFTIKPIRLD